MAATRHDAPLIFAAAIRAAALADTLFAAIRHAIFFDFIFMPPRHADTLPRRGARDIVFAAQRYRARAHARLPSASLSLPSARR